MTEQEKQKLIQIIESYKKDFCHSCDDGPDSDKSMWRECGCTTDGFNNGLIQATKIINEF